MNTRFDYLYRDAGNWKRYGSVLFRGAPEEGLEDRFRRACDRWELFIAGQVRLPELFFFVPEENEHGSTRLPAVHKT